MGSACRDYPCVQRSADRLEVHAWAADGADVADLGHVIAANVRAERARRQWRQADLAERLGWDVGTVGHLETGRRDVRATDLPALCRVFGISLERLLQDADPADIEALGLRP